MSNFFPAACSSSMKEKCAREVSKKCASRTQRSRMPPHRAKACQLKRKLQNAKMRKCLTTIRNRARKRRCNQTTIKRTGNRHPRISHMRGKAHLRCPKRTEHCTKSPPPSAILIYDDDEQRPLLLLAGPSIFSLLSKGTARPIGSLAGPSVSFSSPKIPAKSLKDSWRSVKGGVHQIPLRATTTNTRIRERAKERGFERWRRWSGASPLKRRLQSGGVEESRNI